jgi:predicted PP-loop superfamily ATPase
MVILSLVYGCDKWSLISKREHRLRMFGNRVLREIPGFGPNGVELIG